jgi:uncharacterized protein YdbL (DUF1318 family)
MNVRTKLIRAPRMAAALTLLLAVAACVTVNIYFPAAEVERAADQIVEDVYGETDGNGAQENGDTSGLVRMLAGAARLIGPATAHAQDALNVNNAAIRGLKNQIQQNHQKLVPFYNQGAVGITSDGYLEVLDTSGIPMNQVAQLKRTVQADNQARRQLYQEVANALGVEQSQVGRIEEIFAQSWQNKAPGGWMIQSGGSWKRK